MTFEIRATFINGIIKVTQFYMYSFYKFMTLYMNLDSIFELSITNKLM